jgi:CubicO group peptidase (beta-lactamase class C family)
MSPLAQVASWPVPNASAAIIGFDGAVETTGDARRIYRLASLAKVITTWAVLVAVEEGSITLDTPLGQPGCTLRHLLSHAGGYPFDGDAPLVTPGTRRIYSNTGIELAAASVEQATGIPFADYLDEAILQPLGMDSTTLRGSPAHAIWSTLGDVITFLSEVIHPTLLDPATVASATTPQFPDIAGKVPGVGSFSTCPWGLGVEIHGTKHPHWMGATNSPAAFGHFGGAGTMMWVDPPHRAALVALTDKPFDDWAATALQVWPALSDAVVAAATA